jgi:hypothetical protein
MNLPMSTTSLTAIRARLDAATPGPWELWYGELDWVSVGIDGDTVAECRTHINHQFSGWQNLRNATFIANVPTDLRALLDEVERLTKREDVLVKAGLDLMVANKDLTVERDAACQRTAEAFQRGVETFRRHMYAFALGATSYSRPSNESQLILDELPRMQIEDPEDK